jgi:hypothetical protein
MPIKCEIFCFQLARVAVGGFGNVPYQEMNYETTAIPDDTHSQQ